LLLVAKQNPTIFIPEMSRSYSQSRHAYKGRTYQGKEFWGKRCEEANGLPMADSSCSTYAKTVTHRHERRNGIKDIKDQLIDISH